MSCLDCLAVKQTFFWLSSLQIRIRFDCCCCLTFGERKEGKSISPQLFPFASVFACASISHASLSSYRAREQVCFNMATLNIKNHKNQVITSMHTQNFLLASPAFSPQ